jgi:aminopeptidase N
MPVSDRFRQHKFRNNGDTDLVDPNVPKVFPPDIELESIHRVIDLHIDVAKETASGSVTTTVRARRNGPSEIILDAVDFIDAAAKDPDGNDLSWRYDGRKMSVRWEEPFEAGEERRVEVSYRVVQPVDGLYFSKPDEEYPDRTWYAVTDHETERARHWLPCVDQPTVRTTVDFQLRAEEKFTILANGVLVEETAHGDGTKTAHWRLEQLCPSYLTCFALGDFIKADDGVYDDGEKEIPLAYFSGPEYSTDELMNAFGGTRKMMAWMTKKLDMAFPFPKYYQFSLPKLGGAMENISLVSWGDWAMMDETLAQEIGFWIDQVNVHEMAHSYFGDAVVIRDFAHAWLKESWATYMEQCYCEDNFGPDEALYVYYDDSVRYFREADERYMRPIVTRHFKSSWQMYDGHLYPGGACRLRTLRNELGDEVFWAAVQDYLKRYNGKVVETDDFRHIMEEHSGCSLGKFFDQWFHSPGYPDIEVKFDYDTKRKQGTFKIEQKQVDQEKGIPAFALSTELGWTIDGQEHFVQIKLGEARQVVVIDMLSEPEQVRFDPRHKAHHKLDFNPGDPMLRRQLTDAKDVIGRIQAANELAKTTKRGNIEAIVDAYADEPFWGVREAFAKALAKANTEAAIEGIVKIIDLEKDPKVLLPVFEAAGEYRDQRVQEAIGSRLQDELPYEARRAAFKAMGAQRRKADWDALIEGSKEVGYKGIARSGAFVGLAASRRDEAVGLLLEQVAYGAQDNRVRRNIVGGLADIGQGLEKGKREEVVEKLEDLLRDPWESIRWQAVQGLLTMKASESIPAIDAFGRSQSKQTQVFVEKLISKLRDEDKSDGSAVKKQVEELSEKVRKLEDQIQKVAAKVDPAVEVDKKEE